MAEVIPVSQSVTEYVYRESDAVELQSQPQVFTFAERINEKLHVYAYSVSDSGEIKKVGRACFDVSETWP